MTDCDAKASERVSVRSVRIFAVKVTKALDAIVCNDNEGND